MKILAEKTYHSLFRAGVVLKAAISVGEIAAGVMLYFVSYEAIGRFLFGMFGGELTENPRDALFHYAYQTFQSFAATPREVWAFIFLSHGIVKIALVGGLWWNKLWAYPASAVVFTGFVIYQLYQIAYTPSAALWLLTIFDVALIALILHEYWHWTKQMANGEK